MKTIAMIALILVCIAFVLFLVVGICNTIVTRRMINKTVTTVWDKLEDDLK